MYWYDSFSKKHLLLGLADIEARLLIVPELLEVPAAHVALRLHAHALLGAGETLALLALCLLQVLHHATVVLRVLDDIAVRVRQEVREVQVNADLAPRLRQGLYERLVRGELERCPGLARRQDADGHGADAHESYLADFLYQLRRALVADGSNLRQDELVPAFETHGAVLKVRLSASRKDGFVIVVAGGLVALVRCRLVEVRLLGRRYFLAHVPSRLV